MARLLLLVLLVGALVALAAFALSAGRRAAAESKDALQPIFGPTKDGLMAPTALQKIAYVALLVLLLGTTAGAIGGL